jgi:DNA-binding CsgD family transcriptional regulator
MTTRAQMARNLREIKAATRRGDTAQQIAWQLRLDVRTVERLRRRIDQQEADRLMEGNR